MKSKTKIKTEKIKLVLPKRIKGNFVVNEDSVEFYVKNIKEKANGLENLTAIGKEFQNYKDCLKNISNQLNYLFWILGED